jgi:hypothetical protein
MKKETHRKSVYGDLIIDVSGGASYFPAPLHVQLWRKMVRFLTGRYA